MAVARLVEHYEEKYAHEEGRRTVALKPNPTDRFEAAVSAIHSNFKGGDLLEVGGGDGTIARSLVATGLPFNSYVLTDLSPTRAKTAANSISDPRVSGFALDLENAEALGDRQFDAVMMVALIEHLVDPISAMQQVRRFVKPGGFVYIDTPNIAKFTRRIKLALGQFPSTASKDEGLVTYAGKPVDLYDEGHLHYWTFRSMREMLVRHCGFEWVEPAPYGSAGVPGPIARAWPEMFSDLAVIAR